MSLLKVRGTVDSEGVLTARLPRAAAGATVDVLVDLPPNTAKARSEFARVLKETFGLLPDLKRPEQGELPSPPSW